ncbi:hypothetical protein BMS3Bbin14_02282 [bacterium BMS3Bbin14]|nr:hypothetical protein BMS3Abin13_02056 [bacterium BMS3Abin13]GBE53780.1 hypothetical protein BMS3Bbin14_02282 [bacterium BMS3Bbin14]
MEYRSFSFGWPVVKVMVKGLLTQGLCGEFGKYSREATLPRGGLGD